jgi:alpha-beta hydrolase superfamily lysophospholipase
MRTEEAQMDGAEGLTLYRRTWLPDGEPKAVLVLAHGAGEHLGRYEHVARRLTDAGYAVYALDHRGHGRSEGPRGDLGTMDSAVANLGSLISLARSERPGLPLFLLGHSMGGCIGLEYALRHQVEIDGLILSSPLASLNAASRFEREASKLLSRVAPRLGVHSVDSGLVSRDPEVVRAYDEDPLVHHGKLPARTVGELTRAVESFPDRIPSLTVPLLVFHGSADEITEPAGTKRVHELAGSADKSIVIFDGLYHETMNEPEQGEVLEQVVNWLNERARLVASSAR